MFTLPDSIDYRRSEACAPAPSCGNGAERCSLCSAYVVRTFEGLCLTCQATMPDLAAEPTALGRLLGLCDTTGCDDAAVSRLDWNDSPGALVCLPCAAAALRSASFADICVVRTLVSA